jgi:hypothetical protein
LAPADEPRAINRIMVWVALVRNRLTKEYSLDWLETNLRQRLREGGLSIAIKAVEAADKGDHLADAALRDVAAELQTPLMQGRNLAPGHLQIVAYYQRVARRAPQKRKRGRYAWYDHWSRDLEICFLVQLACAEFGVSPTRNRESRRASRYPSGISLVTAALARRGENLDEKTIQEQIWLGLLGELARQAMAERPIESWFADRR